MMRNSSDVIFTTHPLDIYPPGTVGPAFHWSLFIGRNSEVVRPDTVSKMYDPVGMLTCILSSLDVAIWLWSVQAPPSNL